jgi:aryl-phospho-beta-D-glucosidase BglC (GH1 family)
MLLITSESMVNDSSPVLAANFTSAGWARDQRRPIRWKDYEEIARLKFNAVTVFLSDNRFYNAEQPEKYNGPGWERVDKHVALARKYGLRVVLQMLGVEGGQFVPIKGEAFDYRIWVQPELQARFLKLWEAIAQRCKHEPQILVMAFLLNRSHPVRASNRSIWRIRQLRVYAKSTATTSSLWSDFTVNSEHVVKCPVWI